MAYKPGDFFLGVIDFFGILIPGAVLLYLHSGPLLALLALLLGKEPVFDSQVIYWVSFLIGAYVLGQFLLGVGVPLNKLQEIRWPESTDRYYQEVKKLIDLPPGPKKELEDTLHFESFTPLLNKIFGTLSGFWRKANEREAAYHRAFSFVRLHSTAAITEIERQAAEYKLFRSLAVVFLLDFPLAWTSGLLDWRRAAVMIVLFALVLWRFLFLLNWDRQLTFEFYYLLKKEQAAAESNITLL